MLGRGSMPRATTPSKGRTRRLVPALCLALVAVVLLGAARPSPPAGRAGKAASVAVSLSPPSGPPTTTISVSASGFSPDEHVEVFLDRADVDSRQADTYGVISNLSIQVPVAAVPGRHWVTLVDPATGTTAQARFQVIQPWHQSGSHASRDRLNPFENVITPINASTLVEVGRGDTGGTVESSPAVVSGGAFIGSDDGMVYRFPPAGCGKPPCAPTWTGATGGPVTSSPAVSGQQVYVGSQDGALYAFKSRCAAGGGQCTPIWTGQTGGPIRSSPTVGTGVYVGSDDGRLYAFRKGGCGGSTCAAVWTAATGGAISSSPAAGLGQVVVGSEDANVYAFDSTTGAPTWVAATGGPVTASPALAGSVVYVGSSDGTLYAFSASCGSGGSTCSPMWTGHAAGAIESSPAVAYGDVFVGSDDGTLYAFPADGCGSSSCAPTWTASTGGPVTSSPAAGGGVVFVGSGDGTVYAFNGRSGAPLWTYPVGSPVLSSPAISDGLAEVGAGTSLYAFRLANPPPPPAKPDPSSLTALSTPIRHVVVIDEENHSFDNVLGALCVQDARCDGATSGLLPDGTFIPLATAPDVVPEVDHSVAAQMAAIAGGAMSGFSLVHGCGSQTGYACYSQYLPSQIPAEAALARSFALSDRTFEDGTPPSWGAHLDLVTAQLDGFTGDNPTPAPGPQPGPGWGCDSNKQTYWSNGGPAMLVPTCVPRADGSGPFEPSPVSWVPSIMDRLDAAGYNWRLYAGTAAGSGYIWATCPTLAECIYGPQVNDLVASDRVLTDAASGSLPSLSFVQPSFPNSQHNGESMAEGDNWVSSVVSAIEGGPQWASVAIFITEDDCGCFYDHVPPPPSLGIRVPMIIVGPYARAGFTDSTVASFASLLAYAEHTLGIAPLASTDAGAYDYAQSFDYSQQPIAPIALPRTRIPPAEIRWIRAHPPDPNDPT
jgi:outer membrane protein assembly factor BamB/phospholipase C